LQKQKDTLQKEYKQAVNMGDQTEIYMKIKKIGDQQSDLVTKIKSYF
jgi:hypothetical protein